MSQPVRSTVTVQLFLSLLVGAVNAGDTRRPNSVDMTVLQEVKETLFKEILERQVSKDVLGIPGVQALKQKGVYDCRVRFNFAGECWQKELRHQISFIDNNPFVPIWVNILLLEAHMYGAGPLLPEDRVKLSLDYVQTCFDKSKGDEETSVVGFYPYVYDNILGKYVMRKVFVEEIIHMFFRLPSTLSKGFMYIFPDSVKSAFMAMNEQEKPLEGCLGDVSPEHVTQEIANSGFMVMQKHTIQPIFPSDSDDTFSWLGLGSALKTAVDDRSILHDSFSSWHNMNPNVISAFNAIKRYAYHPFSEDADRSTIDSRTYFGLRKYLDLAKDSGYELALVTTWFQTTGEAMSGDAGEMTMPTFVNDICLVVGANVLYGITSTVLSGLAPHEVMEDPEILKLYLNTTSLLVHMVENDFYDRIDVTLFYYPPKTQFFFFLSRTLFLLETHVLHDCLPFPVMDDVYNRLKNLLEGHATDYLLRLRQTEDNTGNIFYDDFLGDGDFSEFGEPLARGEDRIYATSMVANALMYSWMIYDKNSKTLQWKSSVPESVVATVTGCVQWLVQHATSNEFKPWNAFFSSGRKGFDNLPFWYPANRFQFINGTHLTQNQHQGLPVEMFFAAMQGYIPTNEYDDLLKQTHFGRETPLEFPGYNSPNWDSFAIWSSESYTYASALLSLSLFQQIG